MGNASASYKDLGACLKTLVQHQAGRRPAVLQFFTSCYTCKDNVELAWGAPKIPKVWITCPQALFIPPPKWFTFIQMSSLSCRVTVHYAQLLNPPRCSTKLAAGQLSFNSSLHAALVKTMLNLLGVLPRFPRYGSHALKLCSSPHQSGSL